MFEREDQSKASPEVITPPIFMEELLNNEKVGEFTQKINQDPSTRISSQGLDILAVKATRYSHKTHTISAYIPIDSSDIEKRICDYLNQLGVYAVDLKAEIESLSNSLSSQGNISPVFRNELIQSRKKRPSMLALRLQNKNNSFNIPGTEAQAPSFTNVSTFASLKMNRQRFGTQTEDYTDFIREEAAVETRSPTISKPKLSRGNTFNIKAVKIAEEMQSKLHIEEKSPLKEE